MATTKEDVLEFISNMSVLELSELVKEFEEKFGVSAQATVVAAGGAAGGDAGGGEAQSEFDVVLTDAGDKKINAIKVVRAITGLGLKEAKAAVEEVPSVLKQAVSKEEAEEFKKQIEEAGAKCELK
jgi:large subunit ribosomal protein L7/L12